MNTEYRMRIDKPKKKKLRLGMDGVMVHQSGDYNDLVNKPTLNGKVMSGAVTLAKGDVGLGSVANLDQSKAIKSITRSGTTFTATALDGTTTTFTQQDSNTTYPLASSSSNGLMSSSDKKKLDSMKTASVSGTTLIL